MTEIHDGQIILCPSCDGDGTEVIIDYINGKLLPVKCKQCLGSGRMVISLRPLEVDDKTE